MRSRIFVKLMFVFLLVIGATAITLQLTVHRVWERTLREQIERNLREKTLMFANRVETDREHSLADITSQEGQAAGARATVIDAAGQVLADSDADPSKMENHAHRPEFVAALAGKVGMDERNSRTVNVPFVYVAAPVSGGAVRLAYPLPEIEITDRPLRKALFWGSLSDFTFACWWLRALPTCWTATATDRDFCRARGRRRPVGQDRVHFFGRNRASGGGAG